MLDLDDVNFWQSRTTKKSSFTCCAEYESNTTISIKDKFLIIHKRAGKQNRDGRHAHNAQ